jgi:cytochrome c peroxidase
VSLHEVQREVLLTLVDRWVWKKWNGPKQLVDKATGSLMMLPFVSSPCYSHFPYLHCRHTIRTDYALIQDKATKKWVKAYAEDETLFFKEYVSSLPITLTAAQCIYSFANAVTRLFELGVPESQFTTSERFILKTLDEQKDSK